jgi:hypothetical protein
MRFLAVAIATVVYFTDAPVEMRFKRGGSLNEVRGVATYGRFRQFEVGTEETIQK